MSRWPSTRAGRYFRGRSEALAHEADRRALLKSNPRIILENILSRESVCRQVAAALIRHSAADHTAAMAAAVDEVADSVGVPAEIVRECLSVNALETGQ